MISAQKIGKVTWAERIDLRTGRPVERPRIRYQNGPTTMYPGPLGAHNWQASSYNPNTGLVYIPYMQIGAVFRPSKELEAAAKATPSKVRARLAVMAVPFVDPKDPMDGKGSLLAWDPVAQKLRWRVDYPSYWNAGTMTTAGNLVFQGTDTGRFCAYNAATGRLLWTFDAKLGILAPPITYEIDGRQYVSLLVGYGTPGGPSMDQGWKYGLQPRRVLTFVLDGAAKLPYTPPPDYKVQAVDDPAIQLDAKRVARGGLSFITCGVCHGQLDASGSAPDLRESTIAMDLGSFKALLRSGALISRGMPKYDDLSDEEMENIYQFIRSGARDAKNGKAKVGIKSGI